MRHLLFPWQPLTAAAAARRGTAAAALELFQHLRQARPIQIVPLQTLACLQGGLYDHRPSKAQHVRLCQYRDIGTDASVVRCLRYARNTVLDRAMREQRLAGALLLQV